MSPDYVWHLEDVLDLYAEPEDPRYPQVCFDESPVQLTSETRHPLPARPGQPARYDSEKLSKNSSLIFKKNVLRSRLESGLIGQKPAGSRLHGHIDQRVSFYTGSEYKREGTANLFLFVQPLRGWRQVNVTSQRTKQDFAQQMRLLVDQYFPTAERIRLVVDNLNTHTPAALYSVFAPAEARRITRKLEFHYTPLGGRRWTLVGDGAYACVPLARLCTARSVTLISRLRLDAQWYAFPDPNAPRRRGPKPLKGQWLTALKARVAAAIRDGTDLEIPGYGGTTRPVRVLSECCLWYTQ